MEFYNKKNSTNMSVREIYRTIGEDGFRQLELEVIEHLHFLLLPKSENNVISLGGGLPANKKLDGKLKEIGEQRRNL